MSLSKSDIHSFRRKAKLVIFGTTTRSGKLFDIVLLTLILLSVVFVMIDTTDVLTRGQHRFLLACEWIITILFTIEYLLRVWIVDKKHEYIFSFYGIIDLLAVLPMYLSLFISGAPVLAVVRALRLLRVFRILNLASFTNQSAELGHAIKASRTKILVFIYFVLVSTVLAGTLMYVIEGEENGFTSIPVSIYWCIVTLTTVGFGDITPGTPLGRVVASLIMILGYGVIAVPTGIVTAEFAREKFGRTIIMRSKKHLCHGCGTEDHHERADFCHECGQKLT